MLSACNTIVIDEDGQREIVSVGVTRVIISDRQGELVAFKRTGIGLGYGSAVGDSAWIGFDRGDWIIADPRDCQLVIIVRSDVEVGNATQILETLKGEDICYANQSQL